MQYYLTNHALERCHERDIDPETALAVLASPRARVFDSGERTCTYRLKKLCVVVNSDDNSIVTVYREPSIKKYLKKRRKSHSDRKRGIFKEA